MYGNSNGAPVTGHTSWPLRLKENNCVKARRKAKWGRNVMPFKFVFLLFRIFSQFYAFTLKTFKVVI